MKHSKLFITLIAAGFLIGSAVGSAFAGGLAMEKDVDGAKVTLSFDVDTIPLDKVDAKVSIAGEGGAAITNANVRVYYGMAAMPGMPPMDYKTKAELAGDVYKATLEFSMAGPWSVEVKYKVPGDESIHKAKFNVDVH